MTQHKRNVIVTFKAKDKRADKVTDKVDMVRAATKARIDFLEAGQAVPDPFRSPGIGSDELGFDVNLYEAPIVSGAFTAQQIDELRKNPDVEAIEDDGPVYALDVGQAINRQDAPASPRVGTMIVEGQPTPLAETIPSGIAQIKAPAAWDASRGKAIRVAVLDTGIDGRHPDLSANFRGGVSFVPGETAADGNSHGTHCAGTIAASINGSGVVGVAPAASLYAVKVLSNSGSGQWSYLIAGLNWCITNKMHVVSMSLGGASAPAALKTMCDTAFARGLLLVAAAGNVSNPPQAVGFPAKYKSVIAVSAIDSTNVIAPFSSRGPEVDLCAPGVNVLSTIPGGGYGTKNGTSMACPHVSGAAAVVWGAHRLSNNVTIWNLLASTADNLGTPAWDPLYGYGRVDVDQAATQLTPPPAFPMRGI